MDQLSALFNTTITLAAQNGTNETGPAYVGFLCLLGSSILFGSNFLPVKQFETGDGMFFQLILCLAIWTVGFVVNWIRNFPKFYALPMVGGICWVIGNNNTVPIIKCIGLGMGMLFWNTVGLVTGWANARFGWFGITPQIPDKQGLNYAGVALAVVSTFFYLFVKTDTNNAGNRVSVDNSTDVLVENDALTSEQSTIQTDKKEPASEQGGQQEDDFFNRLSPKAKKIVGVLLSIMSGTLYGLTFSPVLYVIDKYETSQNSLDYVFSLYTGILLGSLVTFTVYCVYKRNNPTLYPKVILPALLSGWMWGKNLLEIVN